jgi:UDP-N-acetyl-D-mannosaminuronate dehydrogenase
VVENSQRDINIAFMNELAMVFDRMDIDTNEVIEAMNTKWNALRFYPGLVEDIVSVSIPTILFTKQKNGLSFSNYFVGQKDKRWNG